MPLIACVPLKLSVSSALCCAFAMSIGSAHATDYRLEGANMIAVQTCLGIENVQPEPSQPDLVAPDGTWRKVGSSRFAFFVASYAGQTLGPGDAQNALRGLGSLGDLAGTPEGPLATTLEHVQMRIASANFETLVAFDQQGNKITSALAEPLIDTPWSLGTGIALRCKMPEAPSAVGRATTTASSGGSKGSRLDLRLRGDVDALSATGEARKTAAAAEFGFSRVRAFLDDGSRKETTTYSIKGVLGATFNDDPLNGLTAFAGYELKQDRTKPAATLIPPATARDGDTDIVQLGLVGHTLIPLGEKPNRYSNSVNLSLSATYLFDLVKDSERLRGRIATNLYFGTPFLGICTIGGYTDYGNGFWSRCEAELIGSFDAITKHGTLAPSVKDHFAHLGGRAKAAFYFGNPLDNSAFLTGEILYLRRLDGDSTAFPHVRRHKLNLGYRWWRNEDFAFEIKGELIDGINPDSFADENSLSLGFGLIF